MARAQHSSELYHHGIKGQKWGVRRFQNEDGSLTPAGKKRYGVETSSITVSKANVNSPEATAHLNRLNEKTRSKVLNDVDYGREVNLSLNNNRRFGQTSSKYGYGKKREYVAIRGRSANDQRVLGKKESDKKRKKLAIAAAAATAATVGGLAMIAAKESKDLKVFEQDRKYFNDRNRFLKEQIENERDLQEALSNRKWVGNPEDEQDTRSRHGYEESKNRRRKYIGEMVANTTSGLANDLREAEYRRRSLFHSGVRVGYSSELYHYGIKGQKWGVRRFQDEIGRLTPEGRRRYREHANEVHKTNSEAMLISRKANIRRMEVEEAEKLYKKKEQQHKQENSSDSKKQLDSAKRVLDEAVKSYNDANKEAVDHYNNMVQFYGQNHRIQKIKRNKRGMFNDRRAENVSLTNKQKAAAIAAGLAASVLGYKLSQKIPNDVTVNLGKEITNIPGTNLNAETPKRTNISKGLKIATTVGIGAAAAAGAYGASKYASSRRNDPSKSQWATYYYPGKKRAQKRFAKGLVRSKYETKYGRKTASDRKHMKEDYTEFKI